MEEHLMTDIFTDRVVGPTGMVLDCTAADPDGPADNEFCATGKGGGVDPTCGKGGTADATARLDKAKYVGAVVGKAEHVAAAAAEEEVAAMVGGTVKSLEDGKYVPRDVIKGLHQIEVKSLVKGQKQSITVHDDSLMRKVRLLEACPGCTFHTVVVDQRDNYDGGKYAANYSGHRIYYIRGCRRMSLSQMHPVRSAAELKRLVAMPFEQLPEAARRGALPSDPAEVAALAAKASRAHASRLAKDQDLKARKRAKRDN